jgi:hypothetical protein
MQKIFVPFSISCTNFQYQVFFLGIARLGTLQQTATVYTKVPVSLEKGSCKIFIAGAQRITCCNHGYLMRTTPHTLL